MLDLFAGSGALGIEALSRGAAHATFVERDRRRAPVDRARTSRATGLADRATVVAGDGRARASARPRRRRPFDLVLLDPPYAYDGWDGAAGRGSRCPATVVVVESDREVAAARAGGECAQGEGGTAVRSSSSPDAPS